LIVALLSHLPWLPEIPSENKSQLSAAHGRNYELVAYMNDYAGLASHYREKIIHKRKLKDTNNSMQRKMRRTLNNPLATFEIKMPKQHQNVEKI
jgi:hypothetical protein